MLNAYIPLVKVGIQCVFRCKIHDCMLNISGVAKWGGGIDLSNSKTEVFLLK